MNTIFSTQNLTYSYPDGQPALCDVSMQVSECERIAILGANASGKSTLLRILDGLVFATSGKAEAFGQTLSEETLDGTKFGRFFRQQVAILFQNTDAQLFCPTVEEELAFSPRHLGLAEDETAHRVADVARMFRLEELIHRSPQTLSGGEKKRVGLAAVLAVGPSVLLLDEPTSGLDPRNRAFLIDTLIDLGEAGKTIVTATHDLDLAKAIARRAIVLGEDHRVAADATVDDVLADMDLLARVNLVHVHEHRHGGVLHRHPHHHAGPHEHEHEEGSSSE